MTVALRSSKQNLGNRVAKTSLPEGLGFVVSRDGQSCLLRLARPRIKEEPPRGVHDMLENCKTDIQRLTVVAITVVLEALVVAGVVDA